MRESLNTVHHQVCVVWDSIAHWGRVPLYKEDTQPLEVVPDSHTLIRPLMKFDV